MSEKNGTATLAKSEPVAEAVAAPLRRRVKEGAKATVAATRADRFDDTDIAEIEGVNAALVQLRQVAAEVQTALTEQIGVAKHLNEKFTRKYAIGPDDRIGPDWTILRAAKE